MKRKKFTDQQKQELEKNPNVLKVGDGNVTYQPLFKIHAIKEYQKGKSPNMIFNEAGLDLEMVGNDRPESSLRRWRKIFKNQGEQGLLKEVRGTRKGIGRSRVKPLTLKEAKAQIALLKTENEFLKKLDLIERGLM